MFITRAFVIIVFFTTEGKEDVYEGEEDVDGAGQAGSPGASPSPNQAGIPNKSQRFSRKRHRALPNKPQDFQVCRWLFLCSQNNQFNGGVEMFYMTDSRLHQGPRQGTNSKSSDFTDTDGELQNISSDPASNQIYCYWNIFQSQSGKLLPTPNTAVSLNASTALLKKKRGRRVVSLFLSLASCGSFCSDPGSCHRVSSASRQQHQARGESERMRSDPQD